ncbi:putative calcium uptake protein 1, mitochondrial [Sesbania bispinosa]|nr:putative calcium uptake protein 1, mitochondrial [Sesbania bispinosa]
MSLCCLSRLLRSLSPMWRFCLVQRRSAVAAHHYCHRAPLLPGASTASTAAASCLRLHWQM